MTKLSCFDFSEWSFELDYCGPFDLGIAIFSAVLSDVPEDDADAQTKFNALNLRAKFDILYLIQHVFQCFSVWQIKGKSLFRVDDEDDF